MSLCHATAAICRGIQHSSLQRETAKQGQMRSSPAVCGLAQASSSRGRSLQLAQLRTGASMVAATQALGRTRP